MFLKEKDTGNLIEILDMEALFSPLEDEVPGKDQYGQEEQDTELFPKNDLIFPSGENLPQCWLDAEYTK